MRHPGVNKIAVPLNIIVCPLQYFQGMLCNDIQTILKNKNKSEDRFFRNKRSKVVL